MAIASRVTSLGRLPFRLVSTFNFSTSPASASASASTNASQNPASEESKKPKQRKKKNLIEVAQFLPNWGIGYHMAKTHWTNVSYQITKINLYKNGTPAASPKKISGVHKRCWRYIPSPMKSEAESKLEAQAA